MQVYLEIGPGKTYQNKMRLLVWGLIRNDWSLYKKRNIPCEDGDRERKDAAAS